MTNYEYERLKKGPLLHLVVVRVVVRVSRRPENAKKKRDAANAANAAATTALVTVVDDADDDSSPFMPLSSVGTGVIQPFSAREQARFAVEVVAQKLSLIHI